MNGSENKPQTSGNAEKDGKGRGGGGTGFLSMLGIVLLWTLLLGLPVLAVFLGQCWVVAWMVAHFFL